MSCGDNGLLKPIGRCLGMRRPIHGDPKISYIIIYEITGKGIAIVDLDTVKPGLIQHDFGDCVHSVCNPAGKEARDLNDAYIGTVLKRCERLFETGGKISHRSGLKKSVRFDSPYSLRFKITVLC